MAFWSRSTNLSKMKHIIYDLMGRKDGLEFKDALGLDAWDIGSWKLYDGVDGLDIGAPSFKL